MYKQLPCIKDEKDFEFFVRDLFNVIENTNSYSKSENNINHQLFGVKGQNQRGIDIFSPQTKIVIQCKLKDIGKSDKVIRKALIKDIEDTLKRLKELKFSVTRLIFTSTFRNDAEIQEYLIKIQEERNYKFALEYWGWDTLNEYCENKQSILEKYFSSYIIDKKTGHDIEVSLQENSIYPQYIRKIKVHEEEPILCKKKQESLKKLQLGFSNLLPNYLQEIQNDKPVSYPTFYNSPPSYSGALCKVLISLKNSGNATIENWKFEARVSNEEVKVFNAIEYKFYDSIQEMQHKNATVFETSDCNIKDNKIIHSSSNNYLVQKDKITFDLYLQPEHCTKQIIIKWKLLARDFDKEGEIKIDVKPKYEDEYVFENIANKEEVKEDKIISITEKTLYKK
ncbi:hypothetical protein ACE193_12340 [Bernardetia sp. OM2101]|uniref:hypothetical protein n=1 Tax=Bernardetia sp. OM2101 TaxID=3344876 RepID=UPI0035D05E07